MTVTPTPITAGLAGAFSGFTWPLVWPLFHGTDTSSTVWLMLATIALIAVPAHAFVLGFRRERAGAGGFDPALLVRIGTWLASAAIAAVLLSVLRA